MDLCRCAMCCVLLTTILSTTTCLRAFAAARVTLYVATNGSDAWSGRQAEPEKDGTDGPLATLVGARDAIRRLKADGELAGPVKVLVREGIYRLAEPIVFGPEDSGSATSPITYAAYPGEEPVVTGGRRITGWEQEGHLWTATLPQVADGSWRFSALWVNDEFRAPARTPNEGYLETAGKAPPIKDRETGEDVDRSKSAFRYKPGDIHRWDNLEDALVVVYHSWDTSYHHIAEIDEENHVVTFTGPCGWGFEHWGPKQRYHVDHVFEALDQPGEWYLNRKTGVLYYWAMEGEDMGRTAVVAPALTQLILLEGDPEEGRFVDHLHFKGLRLYHTEFTIAPEGMRDYQAAFPLPGAVHAKGARYCSVEDCEIAHISGYAIWFGAGCKDNRVVRNHLHDLGAGGVRIGEGASPKDENAAALRNVVDNNWIHDGGKIFPAAVGVWVGRSSYNTVSHNEISDFYYTGVSVGWSWGYAPSSANHNIIEYNHIHHLGKHVLSDMGGIYTLGVAPGTILRHNLIHDVFSYSYGGWGIYPDEGSSDLLIENNVVYNCKTGTFHQHYGRENRIVNNIFAFAHEGQIIRSREEEHISFFFERNIVYFNNGRLLGSNWNNGNYWLDNNCYWDPSDPEIDFKGRTLDEWRAEGQDQRSIIADPLFKNAEKLNFRLDPDSPAITRLGFQPIDMRRCGLYGDSKWRKAPRKIRRERSVLPVLKEPEPIQDDFEDTAVGEPAQGARTSGETAQASIRVTDETAASGKHSLKFTDAPGLDKVFNPHLFYTPGFKKGAAKASFDLRLEPGSDFWHEWRNAGNPYQAGPSIRIDGEGRLHAAGDPLMTVPHSRWFHIDIECPLGSNATGAYTLTVTLPGQSPERFKNLPCANPRLHILDWFGFISMAQESVIAYLDNLRLELK